MKRLRLKVCGLRDNIAEVAELGPDYAGFIFYPKSPRYVGENFEMPVLAENIKKVGVFVNESLEHLEYLVEKYQLDFVQLHGHESADYCSMVKKQDIGVIKAFSMSDEFDFNSMEQYHSTVDYFLFDTKTIHHGGSGKTFNWELLKKYDLEKEYFLSGGIGLDNLADLKFINMSKIHALDVNSRFEVRPGLKDLRMLEILRVKLLELNRYLATSN
jgi:phosphoribosylanthranilate isomerase